MVFWSLQSAFVPWIIASEVEAYEFLCLIFRSPLPILLRLSKKSGLEYK
jgi:hypothetical protein